MSNERGARRRPCSFPLPPPHPQTIQASRFCTPREECASSAPLEVEVYRACIFGRAEEKISLFTFPSVRSRSANPDPETSLPHARTHGHGPLLIPHPPLPPVPLQLMTVLILDLRNMSMIDGRIINYLRSSTRGGRGRGGGRERASLSLFWDSRFLEVVVARTLSARPRNIEIRRRL